MKQILTILFLSLAISAMNAQKVGVMTDDPQAVLHVYSAGQVLHPDGLLMLGNKSEAHLIGDFNYLQSRFGTGGSNLSMYLQPYGGNLGVKVPLNSLPFAALHVYGDGVTLSPNNGLAMIGNKNAGHVILDFDRIQAKNGVNPQTLHLQSQGGDLNVASGVLFVDESEGTVGIGDVTPVATLDILSPGYSQDEIALQVRNASYHNMLIVRDDGHVGIGTSIPHYDLEVIGNIGVTSKLMHANDDDTYLSFLTDRALMSVGGITYLDLIESENGQDRISIGNSGVNVELSDLLYVNKSNSRVGINTATPATTLDVNGYISTSSGVARTNDSDTYVRFDADRMRLYAGGATMIDLVEGADDYIDFGGGAMRINDNTNNVGFGTLFPETDVHILHGWQGGLTIQAANTSWRIASLESGNLGLYHNGAWRGSFDGDDGDYNSASDRRLKKNITDFEPVMDKVRQLSPKKYQFKTQDDTAEKNIGFIAQEVLSVFPEAVMYNKSNDLYGIDYNDFAVISIKAIQELDALVNAQQLMIEELRAEVRGMQAQVAKK